MWTDGFPRGEEVNGLIKTFSSHIGMLNRKKKFLLSTMIPVYARYMPSSGNSE